ncbi:MULTISPECIES: GNAT family N-acetyltransferase [Aeromonas]|jgi:putative acetyltransferase|uniref:GNAT family N-acetyltransferase n=1 Tax=Aeromonas caviae TaxID=648 RepID=A0AAJ5ZD34_AERCA|nr:MULTISPECIES: GNAT family N-acetyltransferase [Aeromonas]ATP90265.1 GNAT family N-acetyltransferase [Aeromonas caviae]AUU20613.1 GNAT family N-acetyltransferase [Aeromonas caviae]AUY11467.1 GNAT family N-acetyltransferase [Aeromonas sp. ASNIH2]AUZ81200.1 GNAT family N-acetyltransferase [Aeromonas sp. ASNIH1]AXB02905.1 GNAT family N-acetyltransferase [Aeromonas caviae]
MPSPSSPRIVPLEEAHIPRLLDLFEQSVRRLGPAHYSPEQVEQWARGAHHPGLASQLREHHGWVIEQDDVPLGFATLSDDGHLSLLYVSADHPRQGLGTLLLERVLAAASQMGLGSLTTEASAFSLALFLRHGFLLTGLETVERGGVQFIRHRLHCRLP